MNLLDALIDMDDDIYNNSKENVETIVKYDSIIMNEADVEVFKNLVENGEVNMNQLSPKAADPLLYVLF